MLNSAEISAWFNAKGVQCGAPPTIRQGLRYEPRIGILGPCEFGDVFIGAFSYVAPITIVNVASIGRYCSIGDHCVLGPTQHPTNWLTTSPISYQTMFNGTSPNTDAPRFEELRPITIGNDVWIGANAAIMGGVTIGDGAIIGFGSVVTKDVPPFSIVAGVPARIVKMRFNEATIERIQSSHWWRYDLVHLEENVRIGWNDPLVALDQIENAVLTGRIKPIPKTTHRITKQGETSYSFARNSD